MGLGLHVKIDGKMYREIKKFKTQKEASNYAKFAGESNAFTSVRVKKMALLGNKPYYAVCASIK